MKKFLLALMTATAMAAPALAQQSPVAASADLTDGEIRKVDKESKKITIKHGEIKNLEMPPMTMVFQVKDALMLDKVQTGDKVRFRVEKAGSGFVVTEIDAAK